MPSVAPARIISAAAVLTLLASSAGFAQEPVPTVPPREVGPTLRTAVVTSALDPASVNDTIVAAARDSHRGLGGRLQGGPNWRGSWWPSPPLSSGIGSD